MKKKIFAVILTTVLAVSVFAGCGAKEDAGKKDAEKQEAAEGKDGELTPFKVAASAVPHAEILEAAKDAMAAKGFDLQIKEFEDYILPNTVVESGDFDANYFQHITYLNDFNEQKGTHLVSAGSIHYEPFGLYPGAKKSLDEMADGDAVAVPNDTTNEARALLLLQDNGYLTLKEGVGLTATILDIKENPHNLKIVELEAAQIPKHAGDIEYLVMNGNFALQAGYTVKDNALFFEGSDTEAAKTYVNVIAVKEGNENKPGVTALVEILKSDEIKSFIQEKYGENVIPFDGE